MSLQLKLIFVNNDLTPQLTSFNIAHCMLIKGSHQASNTTDAKECLSREGYLFALECIGTGYMRTHILNGLHQRII